MESISVLIVEDDPDALHRVAQVISSCADMRLAGTASTVAQGRAMLDAGPVDVLLTDLGLPDGSGLELIEHASRVLPGIEIAVLTVFADETHVLAAIENGATGYLLKDGTDANLAESIRQLVAGGSPISPSIARHVLRRLSPAGGQGQGARANEPLNRAPANGDKSLLTGRESDVLQQIAKGFSYEEISHSLGISVHTVTTHIKNIYRKLAVRSRGEAVFEAVQLGLIRVDNQSR
ncbi:MAG: response regulator transcription factor [Burkholderiaceae bacterium]